VGGDAGQVGGRSRLRDAVLKPSRRQVVVGVLLALMGFAAITQVRVTDQDATYAGYREQDLIDVLNGLAGTTQRAEAELARLNTIRDGLQDSSASRQTALEEARSQIETLSILAGLVPVKGPGIQIRI
jgi:uncharacterized protein YlxW (UPF0749 family)